MEILGIGLATIAIMIGALGLLWKGLKLKKQYAIVLLIGGVLMGGLSGFGSIKMPSQSSVSDVQCTVSEGDAYIAVDSTNDHVIALTGTDAQINTTHTWNFTCIRNTVDAEAISLSVEDPKFVNPTNSADTVQYAIVDRYTDDSLYATFDSAKTPSMHGYTEGDVTDSIVFSFTPDTASVVVLEQYKPRDFTINLGGDVFTVRVLSTT